MSDSLTTEYRKVLSYLYELERKGIDLGLERIDAALKELGNPHKKSKYLIVAGTNGKGSVTAMLASILKDAGFKVGMFTSPHLIRFTERINVNGEEISEQDVLKHFNLIKPLVDKHKLTFFEIVTIIAFLHFSENETDYVVLEVGLGGRLDATNVVMPEVAVITNIGLEHQEYLGNTIKEIAKEKAGVIKSKIPVVTLATTDALSVIKGAAAKAHAKLIIPIRKYPTNLAGDFQEWNAAIAVSAFKTLNIRTSDEMIRRALGKVHWPGRLQKVGPNVIVDCAHNASAAKVLAEHIKNQEYERVFVVFGVLSDKNVKEMLHYIEPVATMMIVTKPSFHRAMEPNDIGKHLKSFMIQPDVRSALTLAKNLATPADLVLVTGSCYLAGDALVFLTEEKKEIVTEEPFIPRHIPKKNPSGHPDKRRQHRPTKSRFKPARRSPR